MTALQGVLVMTKSGSWNRETIFTDIIGRYSTIVTYLAISKAIELGHLDEIRAITPIKDRGQTANQSTTLLYTGKTQQRSSMQEVDQ